MPWGHWYYAVCQTRLGHRLARAAVSTARRVGLGREFRLPLDALTLPHAPLAELMRLWSRIHWNAGDGMMPPEQLLAIYRLAATCPVAGATVELGSWVGLTTCYLAAACRARGRGRVFAVDTFEGTKEGSTRYRSIDRYNGNTQPAFRARIRSAGVESVVSPLVGYTQEVVRTYAGGPIRFLLIDADHSHEGVRRDYRLWSPLVAPGGLIVFHDYLMPDVRRFVDGEVQADDRVIASPGLVNPNVMAVTKVGDKVMKRRRGDLGLTAPTRREVRVW